MEVVQNFVNLDFESLTRVPSCMRQNRSHPSATDPISVRFFANHNHPPTIASLPCQSFAITHQQ